MTTATSDQATERLTPKGPASSVHRVGVLAPSLKKGVDLRLIESYFLALGGTVTRDRPDHVQWQYPGLPTVGTHCNTPGAPGRLISMIHKIREGRISGPRVIEIEGEGYDPSIKVEQSRGIQRPNPPRPTSLATVYDVEALRAEVERIQSEKPARVQSEKPVYEMDPRDLAWAETISSLRKAEVIAGLNFHETPKVALVWWGEDRVMKRAREFPFGSKATGTHQADLRGMNAYVIDLSKPIVVDGIEHPYWIRENVDTFTKMVIRIKGGSDLRPSRFWGPSAYRVACRETIETTKALTKQATACQGKRDIEL